MALIDVPVLNHIIIGDGFYSFAERGLMFLRMGSRATKPGDAQDYERCRAIIIDSAAPQQSDYQPNWARDRLKGAQGD